MPGLKEAERDILLVSPHELELNPEIRDEAIDEAIWESLYVHDSIDNPEGIHDPEVRSAIENPDPENPAKVFAIEKATGRVHVVRHLGEIGIESLAS